MLFPESLPNMWKDLVSGNSSMGVVFRKVEMVLE